MEALAKMALQTFVSKAMNNGGATNSQVASPYHSAKSISQLFKGA